MLPSCVAVSKIHYAFVVLICGSDFCFIARRLLTVKVPVGSRTTGPEPLPKPVLHTVRSGASCFKFQYHLVSLRSSMNCLRLLPHLPVTYSIFYLFFNIVFRRQFLRKTWQIQLAFLLFIGCRVFLSFLTLCNTFIFYVCEINKRWYWGIIWVSIFYC
jgi:hypothetical protein